MDSRDVALSYALTVHKAQGGEYPVVVLPVLSQHSMMLYRNLMYSRRPSLSHTPHAPLPSFPLQPPLPPALSLSLIGLLCCAL